MSAKHILFNTYCKSHEQQIAECVAAAEKRAEEAERQRDCAHRTLQEGVCRDCGFDYRTYDPDDSKCPKCGSWADHRIVCPRCNEEIPPDVLLVRLAEADRKGLQLVNYLGPLMLAAHAVVSGRDGSVDELRRMLDVKYDPTKGEALSLASQLSAANAEIERLRDAAEMLWVVLANVSCSDWRQQTPEWQTAAAQWRDNYFEALKGGDHMTQDAKPLTFTQPPSDPNACGVVYYVSVPMSRCQNAKPCADHPQAPSPPDDDDRALRLAWRFHDIYEALAPQFGYETRTETRKFDAESANGRLMIAVCRAVLHELKAAQ